MVKLPTDGDVTTHQVAASLGNLSLDADVTLVVRQAWTLALSTEGTAEDALASVQRACRQVAQDCTVCDLSAAGCTATTAGLGGARRALTLTLPLTLTLTLTLTLALALTLALTLTLARLTAGVRAAHRYTAAQLDGRDHGDEEEHRPVRQPGACRIGSQCSARAHYPGAVACFAQNELGGARLKTRAIF